MTSITKMFPELALIKDVNARDKLRKALTEAMQGDGTSLKKLALYKEIPVPFRKFITDPQYLNYIDELGNPILYPVVLDAMEQLNDGDFVEAVFTGGIGCGKALALDTLIPTKNGYTLLKDIKTGDTILSTNMTPNMVLQAHTPYMSKTLYSMSYSTGDTIRADGEHLWEVQVQGGEPKTLNTESIYKKYKDSTPITIQPLKPIATTGITPTLKTSPYCLGTWVGTGKGSRIYTQDIKVVTKLSSEVPVSWEHAYNKCEEHYIGVLGLKTDLKNLEVGSSKVFPKVIHLWSMQARTEVCLGLALVTKGTLITACADFKYNVVKLLAMTGIAYNVESISRKHKGLVLEGWSITIKLDPTNPLHDYECRALGITEKPSTDIKLESMSLIKNEMVRCLTVSAPNKLYLVGQSLTPTHNTTAALATIAYQLYKVSCLENPQAYFGLDPSSEIVFIFQSVTEKIAKAVNYARFKALMDKSPYFKTKFPYNRDIESELQFPNRIYVKPVSATDTSTIGQNVFAGIIDEINFFDVIDKSKRTNNGGVYDHAIELYNSMASRRKSRFLVNGVVQGILCLVSSKNYPNDFTERKEKEAKTDPTIFVYSKRIWEIKPSDYTQGWFTIFTGDLSRPPRIIEDTDFIIPTDQAQLYDQIPLEFELDFRRDIMRHLRETAGIATMALHPFIMDSTKIFDAFTSKSILSRTIVDFIDTQVEISTLELKNPTAKRWIHMDLALTGDSAGVVMGHIERFVKIARGDTFEVLPYFVIDFTLEVAPPIGSEIQFWKIRELIYAMRDQLGINIGWVSLDTYQSADTMQILRSKGFKAGVQSIDRTTAPYEVVKQALYDGRVEMPYHERLGTELVQLEMDSKKGKVDHPSRGSKDVADALAGVMYGLITRGDLWFEAGITPNSIPTTVRALTSSNMDKN